MSDKKIEAKQVVGIIQSSVGYVVGLFVWFCVLVAGAAIAWVLMGSALRAAGFKPFWVPGLGATELAYLCGAYALYLWKGR